MPALHTENSRVTITHPLPLASRETESQHCIDALAALPMLKPALANTTIRALIHSVAGNASYLARLMTKYPEQLATIHLHGFDDAWLKLAEETRALDVTTLDQAEFMLILRQLKARTALTIALADIAGAWPLATITRALSEFAGDAVTLTLRHLLHKAAQRGEYIINTPAEPEVGSGIIILGMGKLGAFALNYSSDIDLIVLFDKATCPIAAHAMRKYS